MQSDNDLLTAFKTNLSDPRMIGVQKFLTDLIKRDVETDIDEYRIKDESNNDITDLAGLISSLTTSNCKFTFPYGVDASDKFATPGIAVVLKGIQIRFDTHTRQDDFYSSLVDYFNYEDAKYTLVFMMGYVGDNDSTLPLKVTSFRLAKI